MNKIQEINYVLPRLAFHCAVLYVMLFVGVLGGAIPLSEIVTEPTSALPVFATSDNDEDDDEQQQEEDQQDEDQQGASGDSSGIQQQPQPQSQPQTPQTEQTAQPPLEDFIIAGKINSLLPVGNNTWLSEGSWNLVVESGDPKSFNTHMIWTSADGTSSHTHDFLNLELSSESEGLVMSPTDTQLLQGVVDVATNEAVEWQGVPAAIYFGNGKTIAMTVDDAATNSHFGGQPIYGLVTSFTPCGASGPNMEVPPPCE